MCDYVLWSDRSCVFISSVVETFATIASWFPFNQFFSIVICTLLASMGTTRLFFWFVNWKRGLDRIARVLARGAFST